MRLWDVSNRRAPGPLSTLPQQLAAPTWVAARPAGVIATSHTDGTTRLWSVSDPRRPRLLATLSGHTDAVTSVAFSPDRHTLATGGNDFTIRTWETRLGKVTARICDSAHPRLTRAEWAQYFTAVGFDPPCPGT